FFFQAEDGIRDATVTGVQTCALPIYAAAQTDVESHLVERARTHLEALPELATPPADAGREFDQAMARFDQILADLEKLHAARRGDGRAACRGGGEGWSGGGHVEENGA